VVNGVASVAPAHRLAVETAIERLGYVPNRAARSLVTRRTGSVALVVREPVEFGVSDPWVSSLIVAASQSLVGTGVQLVLMMAQDTDDHAAAAAYVRGGHVDGVLLASLHRDDPLPQQLLDARIPFVIGGRPPMVLEGACSVEVDNTGGARLATLRLVGQHRTRIASVAGPGDMTAAVDRLAGFQAVLRESGLSADLVAYGAFTQASGERAMTELLQRQPDVDAVFVASDVMALGAMRALRKSGRTIPDDVAVVGFDDMEIAQYAEPPLTTVRQPVGEQARAMVDALLRQVRGQPIPEPVLIPTTLIVRDSG
jgi:DNA-binding LacI/PurR family transcriptional regulator